MDDFDQELNELDEESLGNAGFSIADDEEEDDPILGGDALDDLDEDFDPSAFGGEEEEEFAS